MFLAWLWCSTLSGIGLPLFIKLCERPEASVAWPLSEERFGVCLLPPWCSLTRWTGMRLGMAWLDIFSKVSTRTVGVIAKLSFLEGERLGLLMYPWFPRREQARRSIPLAMPLACLFTSPQMTELVTYSAGAPLYFRVPAYDIMGQVDQ